MKKNYKYKRILIFGASGSGKNWLGERLSEKSGIKFYDTDEIAWKKKYTAKRSRGEKRKKVEWITKKESWVIGTGTISYVGSAERRAQLIIILQSDAFLEAFRVFSRYVKRKFKGGSDTLGKTLELIWWSYKDNHTSSGSRYNYFNKLKLKYPNKVKFFSQREKHDFLEGVGG